MEPRLIPYHNLPKLKNAYFHGRENVLHELSAHLEDSSPMAYGIKSCGIHGLGGVGKSQIALEYACRRIKAYKVIIWITADTPLKLAEAFAKTAVDLGLSDANTHQRDQACGALKQWLVSGRPTGRKQCRLQNLYLLVGVF